MELSNADLDDLKRRLALAMLNAGDPNIAKMPPPTSPPSNTARGARGVAGAGTGAAFAMNPPNTPATPGQGAGWGGGVGAGRNGATGISGHGPANGGGNANGSYGHLRGVDVDHQGPPRRLERQGVSVAATAFESAVGDSEGEEGVQVRRVVEARGCCEGRWSCGGCSGCVWCHWHS